MCQHHWARLIIPSLILALTLGCSKTNSEFDFLQFEYLTVDEQGNPTESFATGSNVVFRFMVYNESDQTVFFNEFQNEDFFRINNAAGVSYGRSFDQMFCKLIDGFGVIDMDTTVLEMPWVISSNPRATHFCGLIEKAFLPPGKYTSSFSESFTIRRGGEEFPIGKFDFELSFRVE